jgi:DNA modification methylase
VGAIESTNIRVNQMVVWDKVSYGLGNGFRAQHELICYASKGTPRVVSRSVGNVLSFKRDENDDHPSPKPVGLIQKILEVVSQPGDLILDPFMGAGPTLRAAANLGRRAIGIELNERYCDVAARRLQQTVLPMTCSDSTERHTALPLTILA